MSHSQQEEGGIWSSSNDRRFFVSENADLDTPFSFEQRLSSSARDTIDWAPANFFHSRSSSSSPGVVASPLTTTGRSGSATRSGSGGGGGVGVTTPTTPSVPKLPQTQSDAVGGLGDAAAPAACGPGGNNTSSSRKPPPPPTKPRTDWTYGSAVTLGSDGCKKLTIPLGGGGESSSSVATGFLGWGGSLETTLWPPVLRPSYRLLAGGRIGPGILEVGSMLTLEKTYKPCALDVALSSPTALGLYSHTRFDADLIHSSLFWTPSWARRIAGREVTEHRNQKGGGAQEMMATTTTTADEYVPQARWGVGVTLRRDMRSGVNLLLGHARDIGEGSHFTVHTDVLRRCCATLRTTFLEDQQLTVATRLRVNLITLHHTMLDVGLCYKLHGDAVKLKLSHTTAGNSMGLHVASVPTTLRDIKVAQWLPNWLVQSTFLNLGDFDATVGLTWSHPVWYANSSGTTTGSSRGNTPRTNVTTPRMTGTPLGAAAGGAYQDASGAAPSGGFYGRSMNVFFSLTAR